MERARHCKSSRGKGCVELGKPWERFAYSFRLHEMAVCLKFLSQRESSAIKLNSLGLTAPETENLGMTCLITFLDYHMDQELRISRTLSAQASTCETVFFPSLILSNGMSKKTTT